MILDHRKYIETIKFEKIDDTHSSDIRRLIELDLVDEYLMVRLTNEQTGLGYEKHYDILISVNDLLQYMNRQNIELFETKQELKLKELNGIPRAGYHYSYTYYSVTDHRRKNGELREIYLENPIEQILLWIKKYYAAIPEIRDF